MKGAECDAVGALADMLLDPPLHFLGSLVGKGESENAFTRKLGIVFEQQRIAGFGFDPEILFLAKRHGLRGAEIPVRWAHDAATKVHVVRDSLLMFGDLIYIRWNWLVGRYPQGVRTNSPDAAADR